MFNTVHKIPQLRTYVLERSKVKVKVTMLQNVQTRNVSYTNQRMGIGHNHAIAGLQTSPRIVSTIGVVYFLVS